MFHPNFTPVLNRTYFLLLLCLNAFSINNFKRSILIDIFENTLSFVIPHIEKAHGLMSCHLGGQEL